MFQYLEKYRLLVGGASSRNIGFPGQNKYKVNRVSKIPDFVDGIEMRDMESAQNLNLAHGYMIMHN